MTQKSPDTVEKDSVESADRGIVKPLVKTGLPPGISEQQAKDPGNTPDKEGKNNS